MLVMSVYGTELAKPALHPNGRYYQEKADLGDPRGAHGRAARNWARESTLATPTASRRATVGGSNHEAATPRPRIGAAGFARRLFAFRDWRRRVAYITQFFVWIRVRPARSIKVQALKYEAA